MPRKIILTGLMLWIFTSRAQTYSAILQGGELIGPYSSYFQAQFINGVRYKTWFTGVGAGLDFYRVKGVPVFVDVRKQFTKRKYSPFIYFDGGIHLAKMNNEKSQFISTNYKNGVYYDIGLGYKINLVHKSELLLSAGYSYKYVEYRTTTSNCTTCEPPYFSYYEYAFNLNRLSLKMGWQF